MKYLFLCLLPCMQACMSDPVNEPAPVLATVRFSPNEARSCDYQDLFEIQSLRFLAFDKAFAFSAVSKLLLLPDGGCWIVDQQQMLAIRYDASGTPRAKLSAYGSSPSEYITISDALPDPDKRGILIYDIASSSWIRYDSSGRFVNRKRLNRQGQLGYQVYASGNGFVFDRQHSVRFDARRQLVKWDSAFRFTRWSAIPIPNSLEEVKLERKHALDSRGDTCWYASLDGSGVYRVNPDGSTALIRFELPESYRWKNTKMYQQPSAMKGFIEFLSMEANGPVVWNTDRLYRVGDGLLCSFLSAGRTYWLFVNPDSVRWKSSVYASIRAGKKGLFPFPQSRSGETLGAIMFSRDARALLPEGFTGFPTDGLCLLRFRLKRPALFAEKEQPETGDKNDETAVRAGSFEW